VSVGLSVFFVGWVRVGGFPPPPPPCSGYLIFVFLVFNRLSISTLVNQFYNDVLRNEFFTFENFIITEDSTSTSMAGPFTVSMLSYTAVSSFSEGTNAVTQDELDDAIQLADLMNSFIQNYLPNVEPEDNIFKGTVALTSTSDT